MSTCNRSVLVLGGGGFVGSHLSENLYSLGVRVSIFDRPNIKRPDNLDAGSSIRWFEGEFVNHEELAEAIEPGQTVVHLVSTTLPKSSNDNPVFDIESNVIGTLRLLDLMRHKGAKRIVFVSSGGTVYGVPKRTPIDENAATDPLCSYGISKLAIEKYLHLYKALHGIDYAALRLANPYGERQKASAAQGVVAVFLDRIKNDKPIEIWGDGEVVRDYIYISDAVEAISMCALNDEISGVFNVGAGKGYSLNQLIECMKKVTGKDVQVNYLPGRPFDVPVSILDINKAADAFDWVPGTSLEDGLNRTWEWLNRAS